MKRVALLSALILTACVQPGSGLYYPMSERQLRHFEAGDRNRFEFIGFDLGAGASDSTAPPIINGERLEIWSVPKDNRVLSPPAEVEVPTTSLLRLEQNAQFSGNWTNTLALYLSQDPEDGALTLHALGLVSQDGIDEDLFWVMDDAGGSWGITYLPSLDGWTDPVDATAELRRYDTNGTLVEQGNLQLAFEPQGTETAATPMGRFESLRIGFRLTLSTNELLTTWSGTLWLHPALGPIRYVGTLNWSKGGESRFYSLDRVELTGTNIPLPPSSDG